MENNNVIIIKKKNSFGKIEEYYQNNKLVKKIDYSSYNPLVYEYDSNGDVETMKVLPHKINKKLWLGVLGSLLVLGCLYTKCNSDKHIPEQKMIKSLQYER